MPPEKGEQMKALLITQKRIEIVQVEPSWDEIKRAVDFLDNVTWRSVKINGRQYAIFCDERNVDTKLGYLIGNGLVFRDTEELVDNMLPSDIEAVLQKIKIINFVFTLDFDGE